MGYTKLGSQIWSWTPFRRLERSHEDLVGRCSKLLWIALYTAPEKPLPGLFRGSVTAIADASGIPVDDTRVYLDRLIEEDMVEYDVERRVLRLVELPDCHESPTNGKVIRGWWRKFQDIPACPVRDAHVNVLRWIMEEWSRHNAKPVSQDHASAWSETFGRIPVSVRRPRNLRHVQTTLFPYQASGPTDSASPDPKTKKSTTSIQTSVPFERNEIKDPDLDQDLGSGSEGSLRGDVASRPHLALVPRVGVFELVETLTTATSGRYPRTVDGNAHAQLSRTITSCGDILQGGGVLALLGEFIATRSLREISPAVVAAPGWLATTVQQAIAWKAEVDAKRAWLAEAQTKD